MSQSTDGILAYGVPIGEGAEFPWDAEEYGGDFDQWYSEQNGLPTPKNWDSKEGEKYFDKQRKLLEKCPIEVVQHCSMDYPMYFVAIRGTVTTASRGYPEQLEDNIKRPDNIAPVLEFCEKYNLEVEGEPGWYLFSNWA